MNQVEKARKWRADHPDYERSVKINRCNLALGGFDDSIELLQSALIYLGGDEE